MASPQAFVRSAARILLAVGGSRSRKQFECVRQPVKSFFTYLEVDYVGGLSVNQVDEKGAILKRPDALEQASRLEGLLAASRAQHPKRPVNIEMF